MEEDKHLDARHAIEEAMSELCILTVESTTESLRLHYSSSTHAQLPQVSERYVQELSLVSVFAHSLLLHYTIAFVKEHGVRALCMYSMKQFLTLDHLSSRSAIR